MSLRPGLFFVILLVLGSCSGPAGSGKKEPAESVRIQDAVLPDSAQAAALTGKALAETYCGACHAFPDPALLDKATWQKKVLPQMALRLGLNPGYINPYVGKTTQEVYALLQAGIFPKQAFITKRDWQKIEDYYVGNAPVRLAPPALGALKPDLAGFSVVIPDLHPGKKALTTLLKYEKSTQELWIGDLRNQIYKVDPTFKVLDSVPVASPPVDLIKGRSGYQVLSIGSLMPSDNATGTLSVITRHQGRSTPTVVLSHLHRPVQVIEADLDHDNLPDLIVCNYGYNFGSLVWYRNQGQGKYQAIVLSSLPGACKAEVRDLNHDGRLDVVALFAQGTETLKVFYYQGKEDFKQQDLIRLPPVYGTTHFELVDFNRDGHPDILLANGDNADYSNITKPYHGLRIFLNNGRNGFRQKYFFPLPGAWKALARDFDQDGDLDIAAIAYFPDYASAPERGFVYLEQTGPLGFAAATFARSLAGRWFTLEAADYDRDGDEDILLGSCIVPLTPVPAWLQQQWAAAGPSVLVLQNQRQGPAPAGSKSARSPGSYR
jgi:hypothetical protein